MSEVQRKHEHYMQLAIEQAKRAAEFGDVPVGCVIVRGGEVIASAANEIERASDPTRHAEINAIGLASEKVGAKFLDDCTLYVTLEPCAMCAGAIVLARIPMLVYGAADKKTGAVRSLFEIADDSRLNHRCTIRSGILAEECGELMTNFFRMAEHGERGNGNADATKTLEHENARKPERKMGYGDEGKLVLVPTPIGNLEDITIRSIKNLQNADVILCEDTRTTGRLLRHLKIHPKRLLSYHEHNELDRIKTVVDSIQRGELVALVSDAGMPGISDPGYRIVSACVDSGIVIEALPGPSSLITAIAASGLPTDSVMFVGFPPHKKGRKRFLEDALNVNATIVFFESPFRVEQLLTEIIALGSPLTSVVIARELSKIHEEYIRGRAGDVLHQVQSRGGIRGECVVLIDARREKRD